MSAEGAEGAGVLSGAEGALGPLLDDAPCGFLSFADDARIEAVNRTLLVRLGYGRDELLGRAVEMILTVGSRIFYQTHFFPLLRLHGHAEEVFLLLRDRNGGDVAMLANAIRRERGGRPVTDCVLVEVRERRRFEEALLRARKEAEVAREEMERQRAIAEEANLAKSTFLATMGHELRTPLNAIGGYAQLLEMGIHGPVTPDQREALGRITRGQRYLLRLVNDVLNFARIESGRVEYSIDRLELRAVVAAVLPLVEPQLAARSLGLEVEVPGQLAVRADGEKVQQILINLLSNASKFTPAGGRVRLVGLADSGETEAVHVEVQDTGIGIPRDRLKQLFEPFVQVDVDHTRRAQGTGLGLAISRDLARGMGGDLTVRSELGVGSTFRLTLRRG